MAACWGGNAHGVAFAEVQRAVLDDGVLFGQDVVA